MTFGWKFASKKHRLTRHIWLHKKDSNIFKGMSFLFRPYFRLCSVVDRKSSEMKKNLLIFKYRLTNSAKTSDMPKRWAKNGLYNRKTVGILASRFIWNFNCSKFLVAIPSQPKYSSSKCHQTTRKKSI